MTKQQQQNNNNNNKLTSSRNQYPRRRNMHPRHPGHELRARENHSSAPENIIDQVQHHEDAMRVRSITDPDELQRSMRVRNAQLSDNA